LSECGQFDTSYAMPCAVNTGIM